MAKRKDDNIQVKQSKQWMTDALLLLMEKKPYGQITIKDIAARADLDRRTFYRHFSSKEDVLDEYLGSLILPHLESVRRKGRQTEQEMIVYDFEFLYSHINLLRLLKRQNLFGYIMSRYSYYVKRSLEINGTAQGGTSPERFRIAFKTGGFLNIAQQWLEDDPVKTPEEMSEIIQRILSNGLSSLCGY